MCNLLRAVFISRGERSFFKIIKYAVSNVRERERCQNTATREMILITQVKNAFGVKFRSKVSVKVMDPDGTISKRERTNTNEQFVFQ